MMTVAEIGRGIRGVAGGGTMAGVGFKLKDESRAPFVRPEDVRAVVFEVSGRQNEHENATLIWPYDSGQKTYFDTLMERSERGMLRYEHGLDVKTSKRFEYFDLADKVAGSVFRFPEEKPTFVGALERLLLAFKGLRSGELQLPTRWVVPAGGAGTVVPKDTAQVVEVANALAYLFSPPFPGCGEATSTGVAEVQKDGSVLLNGESIAPDRDLFHAMVTSVAPMSIRPTLMDAKLLPAWGAATRCLVKQGEGIFSPVRRGARSSDPMVRFLAVVADWHKHEGRLRSELGTYVPGPGEPEPEVLLKVENRFQVVDKRDGDPLGYSSGRTGDVVFQSRLNRYRLRRR